MGEQAIVRIDGRRLVENDVHAVFAEVMGFPPFYGRNWDAWIDCMTSLDSPEDGMTSVHAPPGGVLILQIDNYKYLKRMRPDIADCIVECSAFVNWRRLAVGERAVIALSIHE
jgi:hypothetical protein